MNKHDMSSRCKRMKALCGNVWNGLGDRSTAIMQGKRLTLLPGLADHIGRSLNSIDLLQPRQNKSVHRSTVEYPSKR